MDNFATKFHLTACLCWKGDKAGMTAREEYIRKTIGTYRTLPDPSTKRTIQQIESTRAYFQARSST